MPAEARALVARFLDPVPAGRWVAANPAEWVATGARVAAMARAGHDREELAQRAFFLDVHVAQVCRARGMVLWTDDADHARIRAGRQRAGMVRLGAAEATTSSSGSCPRVQFWPANPCNLMVVPRFC